MKPVLPVEIKTERLLLRPKTFTDIPDIYAYATVEEWSLYNPTPFPFKKHHAEEYIAKYVLSDKENNAGYNIEHDGRVIGSVDIRFSAKKRLGEFGYAVATDQWNKGFATEACRALMNIAFETVSELERIWANIHHKNIASARVLEKLGMTREATLRKNFLCRDELVDEVVYGILREEWEKMAETGQ